MNTGPGKKNALKLLPALAATLFVCSSHAQYTNGIYAEFNTSLGSYTCRLDYALAPKTVANFIGLATGQRAWLDLPSGVVKTNPFYNGTTYHRVIAGFMNQGGSPNGLGNDGPGYLFVDEFSPSLRHNGFGVLSMANSGPDSNGSQYFVTVSAQPQLDDLHSVFGRLHGSSNVVYAINHVATDANDRPLTNVVVNSVTIRRIGAAAIGFDIHTNGLPAVTSLNLKIAAAGTNVSLLFSNRLYADNRLYTSTDLSNWSGTQLGIEVAPPVTNTFHPGIGGPFQFFRMAQVQYPASTLAPKNILGRTLQLVFTNGTSGTLTIAFNLTGGGTCTYPTPSDPAGTVTSYSWYQEPYNGRLWPIYYSALPPMTLALNFDTATGGTFKGTAYTSMDDLPVAGTFTLN